MKDHRIMLQGVRIPYTCENRRFATNINRGYPHTPAVAQGSVLDSSLIDHGDASLWLEHVVEKATGDECYWLIWYDADGVPTIPGSGVFGRDDLSRMVGQLAKFIP